MENDLKFEDQMKKLQNIVERLENNEVDLDESLKLYEEGLKISAVLKKQLNAFEEKINELNKDEE